MADNFATDASGNVVSRNFASNDVTYPSGGSANQEVVPIAIGVAAGSVGSRNFTDLTGDAANGLDVDVTRLPALAAGTNAIGKLAANSGVDIGDVDVTSVTPGTAAANLGKAEDVAHASGDTGVMLLAVRRDANTSLVDATGDYAPLQVDANGALKVAGSSGTTQYTEDAASAGAESLCLMGAVRQDTLASSTSTDGDYATVKVNSVGALYVTGSAGTAIQVDDAVFTPATSNVAMVGFTADETATDSVNEGDGGAARMTLDRKVIVADYAHTAGGWTPARLLSAASTNGTSLKASPGQIGFIYAVNLNAAVRYLKIYNKASAPTVGTDVPVLTLPIPASTTGAGFVLPIPIGLELTTGIAYATTTGVADADTAAVAANEIILAIGYK
jgi:hypothetical protein